jgi:O-antigen/teichoic acid export membrane protein
MLQGLATSEETGLYGAAYRIIEIFSALPRVIFYVALTRFAQCYAKEPERLSEEIYKSTRLLLVVMLPVLLGAELFQTSIIQMLYGEAFTGAIAPLAILLPSLAVKMFGTLITSLLQATKQENYLPPLLLSTVVINVLANAILIPNLGAVGAAIATLLSEIMLVITGSILVIRMNYQPLGQRICQLAIASLLIEIIPSLMLINLNPFIGIGLIVISTAIVIFLMRPHCFFKKL